MSSFAVYRDMILQDAAEDAGATAPGQPMAPLHRSSLALKLNLIVQELQANGARLYWPIEQVVKTFTLASEVTGTDGSNYRCIKNHTSASANRPITGAEWPAYWKQTGTSGSAWVTATAYSTPGDFTLPADTLWVDSAWIRVGANDYPVDVINRSDYVDGVDKVLYGRPLTLWAESASATSLTAHLNPQPDDTDYVLIYYRVKRLDDSVFGNVALAFPERDRNALCHILVGEIAPKFVQDTTRLSMLMSRGEKARKDLRFRGKEHVTTSRVRPAF